MSLRRKKVNEDTPPVAETSDVLLDELADIIHANHDILEATVDAINVIGEKLKTLIQLLNSQGGSLSAVSSDEMKDMAVVMTTQQRIIENILTSDAIPPESKIHLGEDLMGVTGWTEMEEAQSRIKERRLRRNSLMDSGVTND